MKQIFKIERIPIKFEFNIDINFKFGFLEKSAAKFFLILILYRENVKLLFCFFKIIYFSLFIFVQRVFYLCNFFEAENSVNRHISGTIS